MNEPNSIVITNKIKRLVGFNQRSLSAVVKIYTANKTVKISSPKIVYANAPWPINWYNRSQTLAGSKQSHPEKRNQKVIFLR